MAKIACIDIGLKRIGVAFCFENGIIIPHNAIMRKNRKQAGNDVSALLKNWDIDTLVVGYPKSGESAEVMQKRIKHFISLVEFEGKIFYIDEYGTSLEAKEKTKGIIKQKKDGKIDSIAASIILQRYLDSKL